MIQVVANASNIAGFARIAWHYQLHVNISVASINTNAAGGSTSAWPSGTRWHAAMLHELGHSFGLLADEHSGGLFSENFANSTREADANVKWRHWAGHRNVLPTPVRFSDGWAVPASTCLMGTAWSTTRDFCGVCTAELVRRTALISGETFHGRSPVTTNLPNTPTVTIPQGATRILGVLTK